MSLVEDDDVVEQLPTNAAHPALNLNDRNAAGLLARLGLPAELYGSIRARDVAARCRRRL